MLRIGVVGGGVHSRENHLPALVRYCAEHPGIVELSAFCDLQPDVAEAVSREYGFSQSYTDLDTMLSAEVLDGCICITPRIVTAPVVKHIIAAGVPLLMEKPLGSTLEEAQEICAWADSGNACVMVSMNRRFDPALCAAQTWRADRPLDYIRASMFRTDRSEACFFTETALHSVDAIRWLAGDIRDYSVSARKVDSVWWYTVQLQFESGAAGVLEVFPNCGSVAERYELFGPEYRVITTAGMIDSGECIAWENGALMHRVEPAQGMPSFVQNGTYDETVEFLDALREGRTPRPTPADVLPSVELCHHIAR